MTDSSWANEVLIESRLRLIEREHKSIGDILDERTLPQLEDVGGKTWRGKKLSKLIIAPTTGENELAPTIIPSNDSDEGTAINHYKNEEAIWKVKSSDAHYSLKRSPELKHFFSGMNIVKKRWFAAECRKVIHDLSEKLRSETHLEKSKMDSTRFFLPEVNEHRAQNLYLHKLYNSISSEKIEDKVLAKMMAEDFALQISKAPSSPPLPSSPHGAKDPMLQHPSNNNAADMIAYKRYSTIARKAALPSFESFLISNANADTTTRAKSHSLPALKIFSELTDSKSASHLVHQPTSTRDHLTKSKSELIYKLREKPFGRSLAKRTSRVVRRLLSVSEAEKLHVIGGIALADSARVRSVGGRGFYEGFSHIFSSAKESSIKENSTTVVTSDSALQASESIRGLLVDTEGKAEPIMKKNIKSKWSMSATRQSMEQRDTQGRLLALWDTLNVPTTERLQFMQKYSTVSYVQNFSVAVDLWNAVAVLILQRNSILKYSEKVQKGCSFSLPTADEIVDDAQKSIPVNLFQSTIGSNELTSKFLEYTPILLVNKFSVNVSNAFASSKSLKEDEQMEIIDTSLISAEEKRNREIGYCLNALVNANRHLEKKLTDLLKIIQDELEDVVPYGGSSCIDWLSATKATAARRFSAGAGI